MFGLVCLICTETKCKNYLYVSHNFLARRIFNTSGVIQASCSPASCLCAKQSLLLPAYELTEIRQYQRSHLIIGNKANKCNSQNVKLFL